ncbi:transcription activator GLK1-like isoform X2 [Alnus glutinosa]|uniref:transcription activator GLK1-like isoform X2 n=1 Tax=Alnus glutinosa TaxID=3517 RepID=UPI002D779AE3|nr:transcription activator GLK1-like isoform X2 [Alnus glutinosa]
MLAVSALRNTKDGNQGEMESFSIGANDFPDFSDGNLLDSIDFDDLFVEINEGDVLPDLEMDPEILADLSVSGGEESDMHTSMSVEKLDDNNTRKEEEDKVSGSSRGEEIVSKRDESVVVKPPPKEADKGRKSSSHSKNSHGKRKVKKYRSHRKHLLAREAEAASWSQRRQMYGAATGGGGKRDMSPWVAPTMGFPPPITPMHHFRPLHVWGHPHMDQTLMPIWPKHLPHSPPPPPPPHTWVPAPPPPAPDPSYWHPHHQRVPNALTPGTPCFPQPVLPTTRFAAPPVPGIPPHAMYKVDLGIGVRTGQSGPHPLLDFHPTKESVDAAIGDVLSKPWLPLPLGLKPPSLDGVLGELQRQGIRKIPPSHA